MSPNMLVSDIYPFATDVGSCMNYKLQGNKNISEEGQCVDIFSIWIRTPGASSWHVFGQSCNSFINPSDHTHYVITLGAGGGGKHQNDNILHEYFCITEFQSF